MKDEGKARTAWLLIAVALLTTAGGCASNKGTAPFMKTINSIEPGTPMDRVRKKLGEPDEKRGGAGPVRPLPPVGSPEGVLVTVPEGVRYRQWIYRRGDSRYHVFFTPTPEKPGTWEVLAVRSAPASKP
jgi:hypothetical protein